MGSLRTGLILSALPLPAMAGVCDRLNPSWNGEAVTFWTEALYTFANPVFFLLALLVLPGSFFRHIAWQIGGIFAASFLTMFISTPLWAADKEGVWDMAAVEGCFAPPYLSTAVATAITLFAIVRAVRRLRKQGN